MHRHLLTTLAVALMMASAAGGEGATVNATTAPGAVIENDYARLVISPDGTVSQFLDKMSGKDYAQKPPAPFATVTKAGKSYAATAVSTGSASVSVGFGDSAAHAVLRVGKHGGYFTLGVESFEGSDIDQLTFLDVQLLPEILSSDSLSACALALNLRTNVFEIPGSNARLRAMCYPRFGFEGAGTAVVACPRDQMRKVMQEAASSAPDLPHSPLGGPWALDADITRGSYLFNFGGMSVQTVDQWIALAKSLGMNQIDFHGGSSFRFGDCRPNPETYPNGRASLKAVIDRLHAAGIKTGLHTYAFFIDKTCPWVTPVPDHRLGSDAVFTLSRALTADSDTVPVVESTQQMSTITGFFERNSVTVRIDDELITYTGISKQPPCSFTGCQRGAYGTQASAHGDGAKVYHLRECFGLFAPDGDSTLLAEVAARSAETFNECGFDMMYLDALDGEDVLGGGENGWYYGSKFVFELVSRLKKPALMEMSTFHHHLWFVRSRIGAMDYPTRSQKRFIDIHCGGNKQVVHCAGNTAAERMFLPAELGWWAVHTGDDLVQTERTFPDDIEYLMCKCMATDTGFALIGLNPDNINGIPAFQRLAPIFRQYEDLRHAHYFSQPTLDRLKEPGVEFTLEQDGDQWQLRPVDYAKHKVEASGTTWATRNKFDAQPLQVRIEALMSAAPYDSPDARVIADWSQPDQFSVRAAEKDVEISLSTCSEETKRSETSGKLTATNSRDTRDGSWASVARVCSPPLDLTGHEALGVWVHGDGQGETLNVQIKSPKHLAWGIGDHYVKVDFIGWRYFELIEPEGGLINDYAWPYGDDIYGIYRERVNYSQVETVALWYNNLPRGRSAECYVSPIKALPLVKNTLRSPNITISGRTIEFPVDIESGCYLEYRSPSDCKVYGQKGELIAEVTPKGDVPTLQPGDNNITFDCDTPTGASARARVTVISRSEETLR